MTAMSEIIFYDSDVFTCVNPLDPVAQGALLTHDWSGKTFSRRTDCPWVVSQPTGELRITAIDWEFGSETLAGPGTLFTFTLQAKADAPLDFPP